MKKLLFALILLAAPAWAQNGGYASGGSSGGGGFIYTGAIAGIPATCIVGQLAFITDATAGQNQYNCSATNTWTQNLNSGAGGASTALDNLASANINSALLAQTGVDLGSTAKPFRSLYLWGAGTYGTTSLKLTGAPTGARVLTIPDATGTFAVSAISPITLSGAGALACALCVQASSPGAGIAHFAGSTQTVTSSAVSLSADVTGNLPVGNLNSGTSAGSTTFWRGDGTWNSAITSLTFNAPLSGGTITTNGTVGITGAAGKILAGATPAFTYTPTLGTSGNAGTLSLFPASGNFTTTIGTQATSNWTFNLPTGPGTNTYVLQTDGSGNTSWVAQSGGSSGISGLTSGYIPLAGSSTTLTANSHFDDGVTTASTITSSETVAAPAFTVTGTCNSGTTACITLLNGTAPSSFTANAFMLFAPASIATGYGWKAPAAAATGLVRGDNGSNTVTLSQSELSGDATTSGSNAVSVVATHLSAAGPVNQGFTGVATLTAHGVVVGEGTSPVAITAAGTAGQCLTSNGASSDPTYQTCGVGAGVSSFSGDGSLLSNSLSTGAVTATLATAGAYKFWGNNTNATAAPGYFAIPAAAIPVAIPIANIGSAGLSATAPVAIASTGAISWAGAGDINSSTQVTSTHITSATNTDLAVFNATGNVVNYAGSPCTNQAVTALSAAGAATCTTLTSAYVNNSIALTNADINTSSQVTNGSHITGNTIVAAGLAAQYSKAPCEIVIGGTGASNVLQTGDDTIAEGSCLNIRGVTETITGVYCLADTGTTTTVLPIIHGGGTILTGALTCGNNVWSSTGTLSGTPTISSLASIDGAIAAVGTAHDVHIAIAYTY